MNKNLLILPAMVFTMGLASCAKTLSYDNALKFAEEHYTSKDPKTTKKVKTSWNFEGSKGVGAELIKHLVGEDQLKGEKEEEYKQQNYVVDIKGCKDTDDVKYTFKVQNDCMTLIATSDKLEVAPGKTAKATVTTKTDKEGYPVSNSTSISKIEYDSDNILVGTYSWTYSY